MYDFFFQAEDGIRDRNVTGVQTCALPICKYLRKISQRQALQEQERMERFVVVNQIESFEQLQEFKEQREPAYEKLSAERQQIARSEERRVGNACRARWIRDREKREKRSDR